LSGRRRQKSPHHTVIERDIGRFKLTSRFSDGFILPGDRTEHVSQKWPDIAAARACVRRGVDQHKIGLYVAVGNGVSATNRSRTAEALFQLRSVLTGFSRSPMAFEAVGFRRRPAASTASTPQLSWPHGVGPQRIPRRPDLNDTGDRVELIEPNDGRITVTQHSRDGG
jgi:hypothetical protein